MLDVFSILLAQYNALKNARKKRKEQPSFETCWYTLVAMTNGGAKKGTENIGSQQWVAITETKERKESFVKQ